MVLVKKKHVSFCSSSCFTFWQEDYCDFSLLIKFVLPPSTWRVKSYHLMQISHSITASRHLFDLLGRWWWWLCTIITENHRKVEILRNVVITKCCFNLYQILSGEQLFSNSLKLWNNKHLKVFSQLHIQPKHFYCSKYIFGSNSRQYHFLDFHLWLVCKDPTIFLFSSQVFKCVNSFFNCEFSSL